MLFPLLQGKNKFTKHLFFIGLISLSLYPSHTKFYIYWSAYFAIGILYTCKIKSLISAKTFIAYNLFAAFVVINHQGLNDYIIGIFTLFLIHQYPNFKNHIGDFFGKISYSLYLIHSIIGAALINFLSKRFNLPYQKLLVISLGFIISIVFAYFFWKLIEHPTHKLAKRLKK
ncbi:hypothetical protein PQO03_20525 [Lentisphaera profundi]|uniref:Acyltransferase 3 domain-containing protein n=1 Tax=Lentisphaera profundi TaxID=1658616 RepID=A0ABY7VWC1_9BACT|nr:hypothetical protein [Lentisphaera profundi]WDE98206.1 hypothetical protein PQO03_20525 [Lentisphaera profundi]